MSGPIALESFFRSVHERLSGAGFRWIEGATIPERSILGVAHKCGFQLTKFGNSEELYVFGNSGEIGHDELRRFCSDAFRLSLRNKGCFLPRGFFNCVWTYAVAIVDSLDPATADAVRTTAPAKHWASAEIPAVVDLSTGELTVFEKTPLWGAAFYRGFRKNLRKFVAP